MNPLRRAAGSLIVIGLSSEILSGMERAWLRLVQPGGVILFRRNIDSAAQTRALLKETTGLCAPHAFRCVDVEGGTVDRLRDALAPLPSAQAVAQANAARELGRLIGQSVRAFGFNTTLAPVLDLGLAEGTSVMGTRCAGTSPAQVIHFAGEFLAGLHERGAAGCGKHFPGLGAGTKDSHLDTPAILRPWKQIWSDDLEPYRALARRLPMIMVNHAAYPKTKGGKRPASVSTYWMTTVLRKEMGYRGVVFSDDLEMGGILKFMPMEEAAVEALRAGMDTVEICHSAEQILRAYEALVREAESSAAFRRIVYSRARRMERKRAELFAKGTLPALNKQQFEALRSRIRAFHTHVMKSASSSNETVPAGPRSVVETA